MLISAEISFYPLTDDFKQNVLDVIQQLQSYPDISVQPNRMSTQVFGEFEAVTQALNGTMQWSFERYGHAVFVSKIMRGDRSPKPTS